MPTIKLSEVCTKLNVTYKVNYINLYPSNPNIAGHYQVAFSEPIYNKTTNKAIYCAKYHAEIDALLQVCSNMSGQFLETRTALGLPKKVLDLRKNSFNFFPIQVVP